MKSVLRLVIVSAFVAGCSTMVTAPPASVTQPTASVAPSEIALATAAPAPTMTPRPSCLYVHGDLCQQAIDAAVAALPAGHEPVLGVTFEAPQVLVTCPNSQSFDPTHPETCIIFAEVATSAGTTRVDLQLSASGWTVRRVVPPS